MTEKHTKTMPDGVVIDVCKLWALTTELVPAPVLVSSMVKHVTRSKRSGFRVRRYKGTDMGRPIMVGMDGILLDGRHRLCRAIDEGIETLMAVRVSDELVMMCVI